MIKLIKSSFYNEKDTKNKLSNFILKCDRFSMDKECRSFEELFAKKQRRKYAVFVNSGSSANLILIQSLLNLGIFKKGDVIGVSALTWGTNVMPLIQLGLEPYVIDCEIDTLNISPKILKKHISEIKGLFLTNTLGLSDDIQEIENICKKHRVTLIEDNCESLGSIVKGKLLGNFGLASTFSTFVGHHLSTIEGGLVCTDDNDLHDMLVMTRSHGWTRNLSKDRKNVLKKRNNTKVNDFYDKYTFHELAYNVRPTEINGFIGKVQLKYWDTIVKKREKNWNILKKIIENNKQLYNIRTDHMDLVSSFAIPLIAKSVNSFLKYKKLFEKNDIEIRPIIAGNISLQPFLKKNQTKKYKCPNAQYIHSHGFYFGNNPELTAKEIKLFEKLLS